MADIKFKLTDEVRMFGSTKLFRIEATASFSDVKKGDKGGFVEKRDNLSEDGDAWVYGDAQVSGNARVSGNAWVSGNARVYGNAWVYGDARVSLKKAYTKGYFLSSSDQTIVPVIIDQSKENNFDSGEDYKYLLVTGDYEISDIEPEAPEQPKTMEIGGKTYEVSDELTEALKKLKEVA